MAREPEKEVTAKAVNNRFIADSRGWLLALGALVILILVFLAGMAASYNHRHKNFAPGFYGGYGYRMPMMGGQGNHFNANQNRFMGVVTAVNGSSFTLAGSGSTTQVSTSSATQYQDGNQVKQNDTVIVWGSTSNGTLQASRIAINP